MSMAARAAGRLPGEQTFDLWSKVYLDSECEDSHAKALYFQAEWLFGSGVYAGLAMAERLIERHPGSYWARRAVELLAQQDESLCRLGIPLGPMLEGYYERLKSTPIAGHLLYYAALWRLHPTGVADTPPGSLTSSGALYLLLVLIDYHQDSPLWDDSLWLAADVLREAGFRGDEASLLEEALIPHPGWGTDELAGGFVQKVRYRLAKIYAAQGRFEEALDQLSLVVNLHPALPLKDDAVWEISKTYAALGDEENERKALEFLLENLPWSRYAAEASLRLEGGRH